MKKKRNRISVLMLSLLLAAGSALTPFMEAEAAKRSYAVTAEKEEADEEVVVREETDAEGASDEKEADITSEADKKDDVGETEEDAGEEQQDSKASEEAAGA
ncbi:MAG: hypothetical protein IJU50_04220, partial [Lachnospiraceae bacterium]|nr:hypothetical protein [Lachnospiraceae bacterium]